MCRPKHVEQLRNTGIINSTTRLHLAGSFYEIYITMHGSKTRQDRWIQQTELVFTLAKNATKPNSFEIISLQITRKKNNWKTEETLARTVVTLETERIKGSNPWCLWWCTDPWTSNGEYLLLNTSIHTIVTVLRMVTLIIQKCLHLASLQPVPAVSLSFKYKMITQQKQQKL